MVISPKIFEASPHDENQHQNKLQSPSAMLVSPSRLKTAKASDVCTDRHHSLMGLRRYSTPEQNSCSKHTEYTHSPTDAASLRFCHPFSVENSNGHQRNMVTLPGHQVIRSHLEVPDQLGKSGGVVEGIVENQALRPGDRYESGTVAFMLSKMSKKN